MRASFHRSTVLALAGLPASKRVIPAEQVQDVERAAAATGSAGQRIHEAQVRCLQDLETITQAGWKQGYERGHALALTELSGYLDKLEQRSREIDRDLMGLVMDAVTRIVGDLPPDLLTERLIESALSEVRDERGKVILRVHPERAQAAEAWLSRPASHDRRLQLSLEIDATLGRDDCVVETSSGVIEAGLSTQLAALGAILHDH